MTTFYLYILLIKSTVSTRMYMNLFFLSLLLSEPIKIVLKDNDL